MTGNPHADTGCASSCGLVPFIPLTSFGSIRAGVSSAAVISPQATGVSSDAIVAAVEVASDAAGMAPPRPRPRVSLLPRPRLPLPSI